MKKGLRFTLVLLLLFSLTICQSCGSGGGSSDAAPPVTVSWQPDAGGFLQYSTNDPALYNSTQVHANNTIQSTMTSLETQVKRVSGSTGTGYGILFCYQDPDNTYGIAITTGGQYLILRSVNGVNSYYNGSSWSSDSHSSWLSSSHLITGLNKINSIKVTYAGSANFNVYFNGTYEISFNDANFTGGDSLYMAAISTAVHENFPTPSDMRFKQIDPDLSTAHAITTITWQPDADGFTQFSTNDTNYIGWGEYHLTGALFNPFHSVEMQAKKLSGYSNNGYGFIFCTQDTNNFYRILITATGYYLISKKVSGSYSHYLGGVWTTSGFWPSSGNLVTGLGNTNSIKVISTGGGNFDVYFNNVLETSFNDSTFAGGRNGYYTFIGSVNDEGFPTPMDVRVKLIAAD